MAVGLCIPCYLGKHESCNDAVSTLGCACPCTEDDESPSLPLSGDEDLI